MTTTPERYTADPLVDEGLWMFERAGDDGDKLYVKAIRSRLQSLEAENARLREALTAIDVMACVDRSHPVISTIARNALKED